MQHEFIYIVFIYYQPSEEVLGEGGDTPGTHRKANFTPWMKPNLSSLICHTFHK